MHYVISLVDCPDCKGQGQIKAAAWVDFEKQSQNKEFDTVKFWEKRKNDMPPYWFNCGRCGGVGKLEEHFPLKEAIFRLIGDDATFAEFFRSALLDEEK